MLVEQREKELCELQSGKRGDSKSKKNRKKSRKPMVSVVQKLFETCKEVFANGGPGIVPSPDDVEKLRSVLDGMKLEDVGLTLDLPYFRKVEKRGVPLITYLHIYECNKFSIGIFCLPPSGVIPLHNHPGMTVFSKLLFGSMHIKSYDWVTEAPEISKENLKPSQTQPAGTRLAMVNTDSVFTAPCKTSILYPAAGGNMHCFTALTPCVVLDVLGPPYSDSEGRECVYYRDVPANLPGDVADVPVGESEKHARVKEKEGALRLSNVLVCPGDVTDEPTSGSGKNALLEEEKTEKSTGERPLGWSSVGCTDDVANVPTTESEKNALLEEKEKSEKPASESGKCVWLQEKEKPATFVVLGALYRGPKVIKS